MSDRQAGRVIAPKPADGPIVRELAKALPRERARLRALALAKVAPAFVLRDGLQITLLRPPLVLPNGALQVWVSAMRDGVAVPVDNPYLFVNPPVLVPDGSWRVEAGREVENFREDAGEAFRVMLAEAVGRLG